MTYMKMFFLNLLNLLNKIELRSVHVQGKDLYHFLNGWKIP